MYNKNNPNYKLYLAGIITENQYYEMLEGKKKIFVLVGGADVAQLGLKGKDISDKLDQMEKDNFFNVQ